MMEVIQDLCNKYPDEPILGFFNFKTPNLIVQNAEYLEKILIKDFSHFTDHGFESLVAKTKNPFDESLFMMTGNKWRAFRHKLSPIFTSGKLKSMFSSMEKYSDSLNEFLKTKSRSKYEIKEATGLFSMDVIGSSIFGLECNVLKDPDSEYNRIGKNIFEPSMFESIKFILMVFLPGFVIRLFGWSFNKKKVITYFSKIVRDTLNYRSKNNIQRNDMIQLLLQLKEKKTIEISSWDSNDDYLKTDEIASTTNAFEVTDTIITVQAFSFLIGAFDSLSLTMMYACFELTQNPDVQERARSEVFEQVKLHSGLNYEALKSMTYLENVIKETLRLHPVVPGLMRCCTKDYTFPNGYIMRKGEILQIPTLVIHKNENYFSDPEYFKPERFDHPIKPATFLPFGDGPRICLAMRYALLETKLGIASILMNYKIKLSPQTKLPIELKATTFFLMPKDKLLFDLEEIVK